MYDFETIILENLQALGGRAKLQDIYQRILRSHVTSLQRSGEIVSIGGIYCLTEKGYKRIGIEPTKIKPPSPSSPSFKYWVDGEFGGVIETRASMAQSPRNSVTIPKGSHKPGKIREKSRCSVCGVSVRVDRLKRHMQKVHPGSIISPTTQKSEQKSSSPEAKVEFPEESVYQSHHETRYGDKYVGQMRRDYDGTFGSLPLYDDYGDESGSD